MVDCAAVLTRKAQERASEVRILHPPLQAATLKRVARFFDNSMSDSSP